MRRLPLLVLALAALLMIAAVPDGTGTNVNEPFADAETVELSAPQPDWYTPQLHADVLAAAERGDGVAIPEGTDVPASALAFTGIRPGSWMVSPAGCTLNFVFGDDPNDGGTALANGSDDRGGGPPDHANNGGNGGDGGSGTYIGTAGHCTEKGDEVTIVAAPGILMNIGTTVKSVDNGVGDDFALIEVRDSMVQHVNPSMAYLGGPTATGDPRFGDLIDHVGHGLVIGTGGTPRAGAVVYRGDGEETNSDAFAWDGAASPGDSGSPVQEVDGTAAGDLTHLVIGGKYVPGIVAGTSIDRMLEIAGQPLVTAPFGPDPTS